MVNDPMVTSIRVIEHSPKGQIKVKLNFNQDWIDLPQRSNKKMNYTRWTQLPKQNQLSKMVTFTVIKTCHTS